MGNLLKVLLQGSFIFVFSLMAGHSQKLDNIPYYPGEHLYYDLKVGFFTIGKADILFKGDSVPCGSFIQASAKSVGVVKFLKDIEYNFNACMDPHTGLPSTSTRIIREGEYTNNNIVHYYHTLREDSSIVYSEKIDSVVVPKNIYDILTGFFHFRSNYLYQNMPGFQTITITTFFVDEIWDLTIRYAGKETIETIYGEKECFKIMPVTEVGQFFKTENDMTIWVTNDKHLIPVKFFLDLKVGSLTATLKKYKPPKTRFKRLKTKK